MCGIVKLITGFKFWQFRQSINNRSMILLNVGIRMQISPFATTNTNDNGVVKQTIQPLLQCRWNFIYGLNIARYNYMYDMYI